MIVDNLGKERRRLGEYLPEVFETCLANFLYYLPRLFHLSLDKGT